MTGRRCHCVEKGVDADVVDGVPERNAVILLPPVGRVGDRAGIALANLVDQGPPVRFALDRGTRQLHADTEQGDMFCVGIAA